MTKDGKLSKRDMATLERAWTLLSDWTQLVEDRANAKGEDPDCDPLFVSAMEAVVGLCEFVNCYED